MQNTISLAETVWGLIESKSEGEYWDFKEVHHTNKASLLHDVICMANNLVDRDGYIIFGVEDGTFAIKGVEGDCNRRNQQDFVNQLKDKSFTGGMRPRILLQSIILNGHDIDVLTVRNTNRTPYTLDKDFADPITKKTVHAHRVYVRVGDTNTDIDKNADINHVEYLWKKRFGIEKSALERFHLLLDEPEEWIIDFDIKKRAYHKYNPEFLIELSESKQGADASMAFYTNPQMFVGTMSLRYHTTIIDECDYWMMDGGRRLIPAPRNGTVTLDGQMSWYHYYTMDSIIGKLLRLCTNDRLDYSSREARCAQFLLFGNEEMRREYEGYYLDHYKSISDDSVTEAFRYEIETDRRECGLVFSAFHIGQAFLMYKKWGKGHIPKPLCAR